MATVTSSKRQLTHTSNTYESNGDVTIGGNLNINGTTTTIDTANLLVEDKNIIIGDVSSPSDTTADGGGITLKGASDKTINWVNSTDSWTSNQRFSAPNLTLTGLSNQSSEATALVVNGSNVVGTRELGSAAFSATSAFATASHSHAASDITSGTLATARIPSLAASKITSGTFADARIASASNWNTAYTDRNKWDGGSTGLNASTGRTSLGLGSAATSNTSAFAAAGDENIIDGATSIWNADGDGDVFAYNDSNPVHNSKSTGAVIYIRGDGANDHSLVRAGIFTSDHVSTANGYYVGTLLGTGNSTTTQVINSSGAWTGSVIPAAKLSTATTQSSSENSTKIATTAYVKDQGYTANSGTVTSVTVNTAAGLDGAGTITSSGTVNLSLDLSELTDMTGAINTSQDELILLDNGAERRKLFSEIFGSNAYNSTTIPTNNNQLTNGASYITGNQTITLSGDVSGSGTTSISVTVNDDSHNHHRLDSTDDRDMKPNTSGISTSVQAIKPFFSSYGGMTGSANTTYVDVLAFDTYSDSSGGGPSAITFKKGNGSGNPEMHIWKAGFGATTWGTGQRVFADNYHPNADTLTTARTITLSGAVTGSASFNGGSNITIATTATADPTLTLSGDASGSATFTNLGNATLSVTVANDSHTHDGRYYTETETNGFLNLKANLASPALTGNPTAPTQAANNNSTRIATTAYVQTEIGDLIGGAPAALDTLNELAAAIGDDASYASSITTALAGKLSTTGKAADSNLLDGLDLHTGRNNQANKVVRTDGNGYIQAGWINTTSGANTTQAINRVYASTDSYIRYYSAADFGAGIGQHISYNDLTNKPTIPSAYSLPLSSSSTRGGVKIGFSESGKNYPVELDSSEKMFVNVPWSDTNTNTTYSAGTGITLSGTTFSLTDTASKLNTSGGTLTGDLTIGNGSADTNLHIKKSDNNVSDHIVFYNGTTRVGEIGVEDTTWLRINQETAKNIYTPRMIRADGGFLVDGTSKGIDGSGNFFGGTITGASDANVSNWNTAYGWGNHASAGYVTSSGNTVIGTDSDINTSGATVVDQLNMTDGVIQSHSTRTLTLAELGYTGATNANNYSLPLAASGTRGGVKIGFSESGKNYPVELDSSEKMFVNVPWVDTNTDTNTTYSAGTGLTLSGTTFSITDTISDSASNSTIVKRKSGGYIFANYFNTTPNTVSSGITQICVETGNDGYIRHGTAAAVRSFINVASGANNYSLPAGSSSTRGGFKIGFSETGKYYPVETSAEKMFVHVPWVDTNTNTTYFAGRGLDESSGEFRLETDLRDSISYIGYDSNDYIQWSNNSYCRTVVSGTERFRVNTSGIDVNGTATASGFQTDTSSSNYNLISRNGTSFTLYVQAAQSNSTQPIASFRYGSATANGGTETFRIRKDNVNVFGANFTVGGSITGNSKNFSIPHPTKEGKRLVHSCLEGPEIGVYFRGRSTSATIEMPDYWDGLVHLDSMTVELTAIGPNQDLYVADIADDGDVTVASNTETPLNYFYVVYGERKDIDKLEVEIDDTVEVEESSDNSEEP